MPISFMMAEYALFGGGHEPRSAAVPATILTTTLVPSTEHQAAIETGVGVALDSAVVAGSAVLEHGVNAFPREFARRRRGERPARTTRGYPSSRIQRMISRIDGRLPYISKAVR